MNRAGPDPTAIADRDRDFAAFFTAHRRGVLRYVRGRLGDEGGEAEDLCTEVFVIALRKYDEVRQLSDSHARHWLLRVAAFKCQERHRARSRRARNDARVPIDIPDVDPIGELQARTGRDVDGVAVQVRAVIEELHPNYVEVLRLDMTGDLNDKQMAEALGTTHSAVRVRLTRARQAFRLRYERRYGSPLATNGGEGHDRSR